MKNIISNLALIMLTTSFFSQNSNIKLTENMENINKISIEDFGQIRIIKDSVYYVDFKCPKDLKKQIIIKKEDQTLFISSKKIFDKFYFQSIKTSNGEIKTRKPIELIIHTPYLEKIEIESCGALEISGIINTEKLVIEVASLGRLDIIGAQNLILNAENVGDISFTNTNKTTKVDMITNSIGKLSINNPMQSLNVESFSLNQLHINSNIKKGNLQFTSVVEIDGKGVFNELNFKSNNTVNNVSLNVKKQLSIEAYHSNISIYGKPEIKYKKIDKYSSLNIIE